MAAQVYKVEGMSWALRGRCDRGTSALGGSAIAVSAEKGTATFDNDGSVSESRSSLRSTRLATTRRA